MAVNLTDYAEELGVSYIFVNKAILTMRDEGRLRHVGFAPGPCKVYQVADPDTYDPDKPETHAVRAMRWG